MNRLSQHAWVSDFGLRPAFGFRVSGFGFRALLVAVVVSLACHPQALHACAACAGQSDSAMAQGMNWGILSLLVMVAGVLGGVTSFFVFLAKKSATTSAASVAASKVESTDRA